MTSASAAVEVTEDARTQWRSLAVVHTGPFFGLQMCDKRSQRPGCSMLKHAGLFLSFHTKRMLKWNLNEFNTSLLSMFFECQPVHFL